MTKSKQYGLEARTLNFAKACRDFCKAVAKNMSNFEYAKQMIRSSASVGANYTEANESLSKKDLVMRIKISKKEAKETIYWPNLIESEHTQLQQQLLQEATEIMKILGAILAKSS